MTDKFRVVCYRRLDEVSTPMTWAEASRYRLELQLLNPDLFYVIEEVKA